MKTFWAIFDQDSTERIYCPYCLATRVERLTKENKTWSREFDETEMLFPVDPKDLVFCVLHARLRIADEFMEILTARLKIEPRGVERISEVATQIGVPYQLFEEDGEEQLAHIRLYWYKLLYILS